MSELISRILENKKISVCSDEHESLDEANVASYDAASKRAKEASHTANETDDEVEHMHALEMHLEAAHKCKDYSNTKAHVKAALQHLDTIKHL